MMITLIGKRLKILRKRLGLTQKEFADAIPDGPDCSYIGRLERGSQYPSLKMLEKIAETFKTPLGYFFENDSYLPLFDLLPAEVRRLLSDKTMQRLLILVGRLSSQELDRIIRIIEIMTEDRG